MNHTERHDINDRHYFSNARAEMLPFIPTTARRVLDIGCGSGAFATSVKNKLNAEVWGIELTEAAATAREVLHNVICGPIQENMTQLPAAYFDCICLNDVIEHLVDPWSILRQLREKLTAGGVIVASIPNIRHYKNLWHLLADENWQYTDSGIRDRTHLRFFTPLSMRNLFVDCDYRVTSMAGLRGSKKVKVKLWKYLTLGKLWDIAYPQFAVVATPAS